VKKSFMIVLLFVLASVSALSCKQGIGERCQVNADCAEGICSSSEPKICVTSAGSNEDIDAMPPIDAAIDAP
jgi:hypothetical protein